MERFRRLEKAKYIGYLKKKGGGEDLRNYWPASITLLPPPVILEQINFK